MREEDLMKICIPMTANEGLKAKVNAHFGTVDGDVPQGDSPYSCL